MAEERFGHSLAMVDGDIVFDARPDGTRVLRPIAGLANLMQAIELRVLTPFGSDIFNTGYGMDFGRIFGQTEGLRMAKELIRLNLVRTIGTDPRVQDIREIVFQDEPEFLEQHPDLSASALRVERQRRLWRVDVVIDTIDEQAVTLPLEISRALDDVSSIGYGYPERQG